MPHLIGCGCVESTSCTPPTAEFKPCQPIQHWSFLETKPHYLVQFSGLLTKSLLFYFIYFLPEKCTRVIKSGSRLRDRLTRSDVAGLPNKMGWSMSLTSLPSPCRASCEMLPWSELACRTTVSELEGKPRNEKGGEGEGSSLHSI